MLFSGFAEAFTSSVLPFLSILTNPDKVMDYEIVMNFIKFLGLIMKIYLSFLLYFALL